MKLYYMTVYLHPLLEMLWPTDILKLLQKHIIPLATEPQSQVWFRMSQQIYISVLQEVESEGF